MIHKKVCLLGAFAVGKTSLVSRFVRSIFSDKYLTTVGVKVAKKTLVVDDHELTLVLWDIYGRNELQTVHQSYLRGSSGYLLVVDGTRPETAETAGTLHRSAEQLVGDVPFVVALNKADLASDWRVDEQRLRTLLGDHPPIVRTSAKTGAGVEEMFEELARAVAAG